MSETHFTPFSSAFKLLKIKLKFELKFRGIRITVTITISKY